ncbi:putative retrotransposon ty1-copia subclass protein, partial [Tanacetum coccineum]
YAARILNMAPTKKVNKTPYEIWHEKVLNLSYLKNNLISQEASGSTVDFDEIQREDAQPFENTSEHQLEVEHEDVKPQTDVILVRRSTRIPQALERYGFYVDAEEHELGDHGEPPTIEPHFDLPPNCKIVRSIWLFKKKTDMDGNIHTYKAGLVAKCFTQTYGTDYEETFSLVADIKAIRILITIAAYYDYEIWQMDVKTAFLNGLLSEDVYMVQPKRFVNPKHHR